MSWHEETVRVVLKYLPDASSHWVGEMAEIGFWLGHIHFTGNEFDWDDTMDALPGQIADVINTHWAGNIGDSLSGNAALVEVRCTRYDAFGHQIARTQTEAAPLPLVGGGGGTMLPPEVSVAVSVWNYMPGSFTDHRGRRRGRFYLPYVPTILSNEFGRIEPAYRHGIGVAWHDCFVDLNGIEEGTLVPPNLQRDHMAPRIVSRAADDHYQVKWLSLDDKFDSQRRRQHQSDGVREIFAF